MSDYYQTLDAPHFDYDMQPVTGVADHLFRGPIPPLDAPYIACIGGAQTMGRFVHDPYPQRLGRDLALPCLNIGLGGAGPRFALRPGILQLLQRARLVVVQMFSGRSASNGLYDNSDAGRNSGRRVRDGERMTFEQFFEELLQRADRALLERTVRETRDDYVFYMTTLAAAIPAPTVLLWLSRRTPDYQIDWASSFGIFDHYPQLVDRKVVEAVRPAYDAFVACSGEQGLPQPLWRGEAVRGAVRDELGQLWNHYYPSPEMHERAAEALVPVCRKLLKERDPQTP